MFIPIILNLFQYFIFAIFIYSITGRRFKLAALISLLPVATTIFESYQEYLWWEIILLTVIPYLLSQIILMFVFKDFPFTFESSGKSNKKWLKKDKTKLIVPVKYDKRVMIILIISIFFVSTALSLISLKDKLRLFGIIILGLITIIGLLVRYIILNKTKKESIIIAIGSNKDKLFELDITDLNKKLMIDDVYKNDIYFTDYIGQIDILNEINIRKYIYLISSNDLKEIDQGFEIIENDTMLKEILANYNKYNKTITKVHVNPETKDYTITKKRILK